MKLKNLLIAVLVLAVLSGAVYWFNRPAPPPPADPRVGQPLVDQAAVEHAAKLRLTDQGKSVTLSRQSNGTWRDDSYYGLPVDFSKLSSFMSDLESAKLDRVVTSNPQRIARLEFTGTKIELLDGSDHDTWSVDLGKNADQGGRFARFAGDSKAYLATLNAWLDTDPKSWADAALLTLKADDIASVELPLDGKTVTVTRAKKDAPWTASPLPAGQQLKSDKIASAVSSLTALRFSDSSDPADPAVAPAKAHRNTYKLTTFEGKSYTVALGRKPEEKKLKPIDKNAKVDLSFKPGDAAKPAGDAAKPPTPEYDTTPAGPVYVWIKASDRAAPVNALMEKRAFQVDEYTFTSLPHTPDDLFEPAPKPVK